MNKLLILIISVYISSCATPSFKVRNFDESKLNNGLNLIFIKDATLPYVTFSMLIGVGNIHDGSKYQGLNSLTASLLDKGAGSMSATQISDKLGQMGAWTSSQSSREYTILSAGGLSKYQNEILDVFSTLVTKPSFKTSEVKRAKRLRLATIKNTMDNPASLARVAAPMLFYKDHPYGYSKVGKLGTIKAIGKKNIVKLYLQYYRPNNSTLAVVGNFSENMKIKIKKAFESWKSRDVASFKYQSLKPLNKTQVTLIDKPQTKQTQVKFLHYGVNKGHPDFIPLMVANKVFGGAFSSRLMSELRTKQGLTYGAYSHFSSFKRGGHFQISTSSRHDKVKDIISSTVKVYKNFVTQGITSEELKGAKALSKGAFPLIVETPEKLATNILILNFYGLGRKYLDTYLSSIEGVSLSEVNQTIKKYFHPDKMHIILVSTDSNVNKQLKAFKYKKINYKSILK